MRVEGNEVVLEIQVHGIELIRETRVVPFGAVIINAQLKVRILREATAPASKQISSG